MALSKVTLTWDLTDLISSGISATISLVPNAVLTDTTNHVIIPEVTRSRVFTGGTGSLPGIIACDNSTITPAGWAYTITVTLASGAVLLSFSAFINFANGATQDLSTLTPLSAATALAGAATPGLTVFPSGDTTGATDQAAITAAEGLGRVIYFAPGTFWVTGLTKQAGTIWQGAGRQETTIKLAAGANKDVVQGANFTTLTLGGSTGGIGGWGIRDLSIDGNSSSQSGTSYGLRFYGYEFDLTRVSIRNCLTDGIYSEWANFGGSGTPDKTMEATISAVKIHDCGGNGWHNRGPHDSRAWDVTIFNNSVTGYGYWAESNVATTVAAGSNGVSVSTFAGAGTLNVASTLSYPAASISSTQGSLTVVTSGGSAVITYTGVTATSFTGCTTVSGSGTVSTGAAVTPTGGGYAASACLLEGVHVWGTHLWDYVLDTGTHLTDCAAEVAQPGGGMVLLRSGSQITGGSYIIYSGFTQNGLGIQLGDSTNPCTGARIDTALSGLSGADAAHAAINIVNDGGSNSIDAIIYQPSGTAVFGTPSTGSRYRVASVGASAANNAANSLFTDFGTTRRFVPAASNTAWRLTPGGGATDWLNLNTNASRFEHNNGLLDRWYASGFANPTVEISAASGTVALGAPAGSSVDTTLSRPAAGVFQSSGAWAAAGLTGVTGASRYVGGVSGAAPSSGTFAAGDFAVDRTLGLIWVCTSAGTPGTWTALQLSATGTDIQPVGAQAAGNSVKAAAANHVHAMPGLWLPSDYGLVAAAAPVETAGTNVITVAGTLYLIRVLVRSALTWTNVVFRVATAGVGASTGSFTGLYDSSGNLLTGSSDIAGNLTSGGSKAQALTTPQALAAGASVWVAFLVNLATTQPTLNTFGNSAASPVNLNLTVSTLRAAVNGTGLTSLPATITPASNTQTGALPLWFGGS